jgi:hypothetical protein
MRPQRPTPWFRPFFLLAGLALGAALGCADEDVECDARTEIEVRYGSDVADEPGGSACEEAPASCGEAPDCACLEGQMLENGIDLDFCLTEGDCDDSDGVVKLVCPGG